MAELTPMQELFVNEYFKLRCKNATQAAINAGYSEKTAYSQGSALLKKPEVSEVIEQRKNRLIQDIRQEFIFDAQEARKVMYGILTDEESSDRDRITVARDFLDRAGFKPSEKADISGGVIIIRDDLDGMPDR